MDCVDEEDGEMDGIFVSGGVGMRVMPYVVRIDVSLVLCWLCRKNWNLRKLDDMFIYSCL